jgi:hypothetical protein
MYTAKVSILTKHGMIRAGTSFSPDTFGLSEANIARLLSKEHIALVEPPVVEVKALEPVASSAVSASEGSVLTFNPANLKCMELVDLHTMLDQVCEDEGLVPPTITGRKESKKSQIIAFLSKDFRPTAEGV